LLLAAGYLNVDVVASVGRVPTFGGRVTAGFIRRSPGGMTANMACAASQLGLRTQFFGSAGLDTEGDAALAELEGFGVETAGVSRTGRPTTTALVLLGPGGDRAIVSEPLAFDYGPLREAVEGYAGHERACLHVDGYRLPEALGLLIRARELGFATSADLDGMEPEVLADNVLEISPALDVVFLNRRLSAVLAQSPRAAAERILEMGAGLVAVTLGERGALVGGPHGIVLLAAPTVEVVDTTGAGDAFAGAFLACWLDGASIEEAGAFAVTAAALSTEGAGARGRLPTRQEVEGLAVVDGGIRRIQKGVVGNG
jgi:sugar/nucleoside kinase (ribokinase family)